MEYVSTEIKNLVYMMNNKSEMFNGILRHGTKELFEHLISSIKLELSSQYMDEEEADTLYLLQLTLANTYNSIR